MHKIVRLYVDDEEERRDLIQEIIVQAYAGFSKFQGRSKFSTWLYRVSLNTVLTVINKSKKRGLAESNAELMTESAEKSENAELLYRVIKTLDPVNKMIISLHLEDYDNPEIAEIVGISLNHVAVKLHRIKEKLKTTLNQLEHGRYQ